MDKREVIITGKGLVAQAMQNSSFHHPVLIFASGVSNSLEKEKSAFEKEKNMLLEQINTHPEKLFVYFSTISVFDPDKKTSPYVLHKLEMEQLISNTSANFLILRLPNLIGQSNNPHTICNFFYQKIIHDESINIKNDVYRYLIDAEELPEIISEVLNQFKTNNIINIITNRKISVDNLISELEKCTGKKAKTSPVHAIPANKEVKITTFNQDKTLVLNKAENYNSQILKKYYTN